MLDFKYMTSYQKFCQNETSSILVPSHVKPHPGNSVTQKEAVLGKPFHLSEDGSQRIFPNSSNETSMMLLPKSGKANTRKENYRPVSLISIDTKIPNRRLAYQIQQCVKKIMHHNQMEFIQGRQDWLDIWKSTNVIYHISS